MKMADIGWHVVALCVLLFISCNNYPRDAGGTLQNVKGKTLRAGISVNQFTPVDSLFIEAFARSVNADVEWICGDQYYLCELLHNNRLDLAIGGFLRSSPFTEKAGFSKPYSVKRTSVGYKVGAPMPEDIENKEVFTTDRLVAAFILKKGGVPVIVQELDSTAELVAGDEQELKRGGFAISDILLYKEEHVVAIQKGENAFLMEMEKFISKYGR